MTQQHTPLRTRTTWVLVPMAMCLGVAIYLPGLTSVLLGTTAAAICFAIARRAPWKESRRITGCVLVVALSYMIVGGIAGGSAVAEANRSASDARLDLGDEAARMKVFAMAMQYKQDIEQGERDLTDAMKTGASNYDFLARRLASRKASHEKHQQFTTRFYRLTDEQFALIVNEGIAEDWAH